MRRNYFTIGKSPTRLTISDFDHPELVCGVVYNKDNKYNQHSLIIRMKDLSFFGYRDGCERNLHLYPDSIIIENIDNKMI